MKKDFLNKGVAISMPVLNEVLVIEKVLTEIFTELKNIDFTICIVDDGSTDGTLDIIEKFSAKNGNIKLIRSKKKGYGCQRGAASRKALKWLVANTGHVIFVEIDSDGAQPPNELLKGIKVIKHSDNDVVIASKYLPGSKIIGRSFVRNLISLFMSLLARILIPSNIKDYSNSYRFYTREAAEFLLKFEPKYTTPIYLLEILVIWIANNYKITEFPTKYFGANDTNSKVTVLDIIKGLGGLLAISFRFHTGDFRKK